MLSVSLSAALIYHDYVAIPRQNRELVEELKTCFPEDIPPGGVLQERKRNRLEENRKCLPLTFDPPAPVSGCSWLAYNPGGWDRLSGHAEQPGRSEYYLRRDYRGNYDINGSLFLQADCILGESKNLTIYGHNMNSGAMFGNLDRYASYDYWKAHPRVFFQTPEGMEEYQIAAVLKADVSMFDFQQASFTVRRNWRLMSTGESAVAV